MLITFSIQSFSFSSCSLLKSRKQITTCFTTRVQTGVNDHAIAALEHRQVDLPGSDTRCNLPDMLKSYTGKVTAPAHGDRDTTQCGQDQVTESLPEIEAFVAVLPDTVQTVSVIRLTNRLLKGHLQEVIEVIWIPVSKIWIL